MRFSLPITAYKVAITAFATAGYTMFILATTAPAAQAQIIVDNPGTGTVSPWGNSSAATFGQVVTAPTGSIRLSSFTFTLASLISGAGSIPFRAYVYAWDNVNNHAVGSSLFTSAVLTTPTVFPSPITIDL